MKNQTSTKVFALSAAATLALALLGSCAIEPEISTVLDDASSTYTGNIRVSLAHPFDVKKDDYELLMSAPSEVKSMAVCHIKNGGTCEPGSPLYYTTELVYLNSLRKFFKVEASALLEDGLTLQFMTYDAAGKVDDTRRIVFNKKGGTTPPTTTSPSPSPSPSTSPNNGGGDTGAVTEAQAQSILQASCSGGVCHSFAAGGMKGNADAISRIQSGNMPKGKSMGAQEKTQLLQYLQGT